MNYYALLAINLSCTALPVVACIVSYKKLDRPSRIIFLLFAISFLSECLGFYFAKRYHNNYPVYNVSNMVQIFLTGLYFNDVIQIFRKRSVGIYIGIVSVILAIANSVFLQPLWVYNTNNVMYQTLLIFGMGVLFFRQLFLSEDELTFQNVHFWIVLFTVFTYVLMFFIYALYDYLVVRARNSLTVINDAIVLINAFNNICFAVLFFIYPKMKNRNGS